jgi:hypothetical protein
MTAGEAEVMRARLQRMGLPQALVEKKMEAVVVKAPAPVPEAAPVAAPKQADLFAKPATVKTVSKIEPAHASVEVNPEAIVRWEI